MRGEVLLGLEGLAAARTCEGVGPVVAAHMGEEGAFLEKLFVADDAAVGLFTVEAAVVDQFELAGEGGAAVAAGEGVE